MSAHVRVPKHRRFTRPLLCMLKRHRPSPQRPDGFEWYFITCLRCGEYL